jgi:maleate isomerase
MPPDVSLVTARMTSPAADMGQRLRDYTAGIPMTLSRLAGLPLSLVAFACTGSSYLIDAADERALLDRVQSDFEVPILTASEACAAVFEELGARAIVLVNTYKDDLREACIRYWTSKGMEVRAVVDCPARPGATHPVYSQRSADLAAQARVALRHDCDAVLVTGTGAPSLGVITSLCRESGTPILSSNLCLGRVVAQRLGRRPLLNDWIWRPLAWEDRFRLLFPQAFQPPAGAFT